MPEPGIDDRIKHHVEKFEEWGQYLYNDSSYKIPEIHIDIGPINDFNLGIISPGAIGVCHYLRKPRTILIKESFWNDATETEREMVVFHELGHCALDRPHTNALGPWGKQISLMYPKIFSPNLYRRYYGYYMDELFNPY